MLNYIIIMNLIFTNILSLENPFYIKFIKKKIKKKLWLKTLRFQKFILSLSIHALAIKSSCFK